MSRNGLIISSIVGLVFAIVEALLIPVTLSTTFNTAALSFVVAVLGLLVGVLAGRVILGQRRAHRYFRLGIPVLSAISAFAFESAVTNWLISQHVEFGPAPTTLPPEVIVALIIGAVVYLIAATLYGFAGTGQGVAVGARTGLLLVLLLSVLPFANVLGMILFLITAFTRTPSGPSSETVTDPAEATTIPAPPATSE